MLMEYLNRASRFIPEPTLISHKGQNGKICVIGGSIDYTGAPYFASISALKMGADLAHVICPPEAAPIIKTYSPELMVHPILDIISNIKDLAHLLEKMHVLVLGPGMGRDEKKIPIFQIKRTDSFCATEENVKEVAEMLGGITICLKGPKDIISDGKFVMLCDRPGSPRRCGGQGDLLSGTMGVFLHWFDWKNPNKAANLDDKQRDSQFRVDTQISNTMLAAFAACNLVRECNKKAFGKKQMSALTTDMIEEINESMKIIFKSQPNK
ncbi:ATP-dependent (S)-NAD(P)H-hydrate dehydratase-like isoform X2 [Gordionus sp. m RMFG-2023]|uniref:ATP-dependent (S)-NAD(P)H-hydrate dehydratase-like isoform X2 n=1 Tax=Gordionus sp. m RMFG-2023 TaxID=3053472 RepID=UPI0031FC9C1C